MKLLLHHLHIELMKHLASLSLLVFLFVPSLVFADDWPQWRGANRDGVWNETGLIKKFAGPEIDRKWTAKIGAGYSGPTVAGNRVFVMDRLTEPEQTERILCFDANNGKEIWTHAYPCEYRNVGYVAGPRASVTIDEERAFAIGTMGNLHCLNSQTGDVIWKIDCDQKYRISTDRRMPIWGIACSPLVYKDLVIVHLGAVDSSVVAFDKKTGVEKWRAFDDRAQYASPILVKQGDKDVMVLWTGDNCRGINPATGAEYWTIPLKPSRMPIGVATPVVNQNRLFLTSFYDGVLMAELSPDQPSAKTLYRIKGGDVRRDTQSIQSIISTPLFQGDYLYGVDSYGQFRCINAKDGSRVWEDDTAVPFGRWSTIHFVKNGETIWMFNERGELIIAKLSPKGFQEISRAKLIEPTTKQLRQRKGVCWSHPAFAHKSVFARNDNELVCASLAE